MGVVGALTPLGADRVVSALKSLFGVVRGGGFYRGRFRYSHPAAQAFRWARETENETVDQGKTLTPAYDPCSRYGPVLRLLWHL